MRTFTIRYSTILAAAIVAVVYSASVHKSTERQRELLKHIMNEAEDLTKKLNEELLNKWVPKIVNGSCKKNVFCLAVKALEFLDHHLAVANVHHGRSKLQEDKKLERFLKQYNNLTNKTNCTLNMTEQDQLRQFLMDVKTCAGHAYNNTG